MSQVKFEIQRALKDPNVDTTLLIENFEKKFDEKIDKLYELIKQKEKPVEVKERIIEKPVEPEIKIDEENLRLKIKTFEGWSDWIDLKSLIENYVKSFTNLHFKVIKETLKTDLEEELKAEVELLIEENIKTNLDNEKQKIDEVVNFIITKVKEEINNYTDTTLKEKISDLDEKITDLEEFKVNLEKYVKENLKGEKGDKGDPGLPGPPPRIYQEDLHIKFETPFEKAEIDFRPIIENIKEEHYNLILEKIEEFDEKFKHHVDAVDTALSESIKLVKTELSKELEENVEKTKEEVAKLIEENVSPYKKELKNISKKVDKIPKEIDKKIAGLKQKIEEEFVEKLSETEKKIDTNLKLLQEQQQNIPEIPKIELALEGYKLGLKENGQWKQFVDLSKILMGGGSGIGLNELQYRIEIGEIQTVHVKDYQGRKETINEIEFVSPMVHINYENGKAKINIEPFADLLGNWITEEMVVEQDGVREVEVSYPIKLGYQRVYWNGVILKYGENFDYIINGNKIIFNEEIQLMRDDIITVEYLKDV